MGPDTRSKRKEQAMSFIDYSLLFLTLFVFAMGVEIALEELLK